MEASQAMMEEIRRDLNSLSSRFDSLQLEVSELKDSNKRALDSLLPRVEALLANQAINISNSLVVETPAPNAESGVSLFRAAEDGDVVSLLRLLSRDDVDLKQRNEEGDSALHVAAGAGQQDAVTVLLGGNIPVDIRGHRGRTALHCASADGHVVVVRRLLNAGANAEANDGVGEFPLLLAAKAGHFNIVELLANHDASLDALDKDGNPALVSAAKSKHWEIVKLLLLRGASAEIYKGDDNAPLYLVAKEKNYRLIEIMIKKIEEKEAQIKIALLKCNAAHLCSVLDDALPGFYRSQEGRDAMVIFARNGNIEVLEAMLDVGAKVDDFDSRGISCLIEAAWNGRVTVLQLLLDRGASVDLECARAKQKTALQCASVQGHVECVRLLLQAGASVNTKCVGSKTLIEIAKTDEIRELLTSHSSQS